MFSFDMASFCHFPIIDFITPKGPSVLKPPMVAAHLPLYANGSGLSGVCFIGTHPCSLLFKVHTIECRFQLWLRISSACSNAFLYKMYWNRMTIFLICGDTPRARIIPIRKSTSTTQDYLWSISLTWYKSNSATLLIKERRHPVKLFIISFGYFSTPSRKSMVTP